MERKQRTPPRCVIRYATILTDGVPLVIFAWTPRLDLRLCFYSGRSWQEIANSF